jgi:hypothetical protein
MSRSRIRLVGAGLTASALVAAVLVAPGAAFAASSVGPPIVPIGGNASINDNAAPFTVTTPALQLSATPCNSKYQTIAAAGLYNVTTATKQGNSQINFTVPTGVAVGASGAAKAYYVCVYDGNLATSNQLGTTVSLYVGTPVQVSAANGITGGGNQITVNSGPATPLFAGLQVVALFSSAPCNAALGTTNPANLIAANVVKQSNSQVSFTVPNGVVANGPNSTGYNVCLFDGSTGALLTLGSYTVSTVALSPSSGSQLTSNGVTATSPLPFLSGVTTPAVLMFGPGGGCPNTYSAAPSNGVTPIALTAPGAARKLTNYRAAITVPPLPLVNSQPTGYQVCFYAGLTGGLVGSAGYTAAVVAAPTAVIPTAGPAAGGNTVTVVGTDFPTEPGRITATLGGAPLTNIQPLSDKAFTGQVSAHTIERNVALVVTTSAGSKALQGAYSFLNPIKVTPNTAPSTAPAVDVDVQGMGFLSINFGQTGNAGRVYLVDGVYDGADAGTGVRANRAVAECVNVLPISDEELICTLQLNRRLDNTGTTFFDSIGYSRTLTSDITTLAGSRIITSANGSFVPDDLGQMIVQATPTNIPAGSIITQILSRSKAVISLPSPATNGTAFTATVGGLPVRTFSNALLTTTGSTTVSLANGSFTGADIGRMFSGTPGITAGTTIVAVAPGGASATLSAPATAGTQGTIDTVSIVGGTNTITGANVAATDQYGVIGANSLGIPAGTTITAASAGTATLSTTVAANAGPATITVNRPVPAATLYPAAPVLEGSYHLTVVSNGAPNAVLTDPDYSQTDITSGSVFTVAPF